LLNLDKSWLIPLSLSVGKIFYSDRIIYYSEKNFMELNANFATHFFQFNIQKAL
jgi:hypothetical protein